MRIKLDLPLSVGEIVNFTGGIDFYHKKDFIINYIVTDSREAEIGDLFLALSGFGNSGENYLSEVIEKGAVPLTAKGREKCILVDDVGSALLKIAHNYLKKFENLKHVVAVTGSNGKTTTKEILSNILNEKYRVHKNYKNQNNLLGVPLTVLSAPRDTEVMVLELGMNRLSEISKLSQCVNPTLGIITNIGSAHIGNLGSREIIAKAKCELQDGMSGGNILVPFGEDLLKKVERRKTVSVENELADFYLEPLSINNNESLFNFYYKNCYLRNVKINLPGEHNLKDVSMAVSAAIMLGVGKEEILEGLRKTGSEFARHRLKAVRNFSVLDDCYNASCESVFAMIDYLKLYKDVPHSALLGDVLELGSHTVEIHRKIGRYAFESGLERLYLFGVYTEFIMEGAVDAGMKKENIFLNSDTQNMDRTVSDILKNAEPKEVILAKASRKVQLERILKLLEG